MATLAPPVRSRAASVGKTTDVAPPKPAAARAAARVKFLGSKVAVHTPAAARSTASEAAAVEIRAALAHPPEELRTFVRGRSDAEIGELQASYRDRHGSFLHDDIKARQAHTLPYPEALIDVLSLLTSLRLYDPYTKLGIALLVTRDVLHAHEVLYRLGAQQKQLLAIDYQTAFGGLVAGDDEQTVQTHVRQSFLGHPQWERVKTLALLERGLTRADELYFLTLGLPSPQSAEAVALVEEDTNAGHEQVARLERDWDAYVRNGSRWSREGAWTRLSLRDALQTTLPRSDWERVRSELDAHASIALQRDRARRFHGQGLGLPADGEKFLEERAHLLAAQSLVSQALSGVGKDSAQLYRALERIAAILAARRSRGLAGAEAEESAGFERDLRARLLDDRMITGDLDRVERARALLVLARGGKLSDADELYLIAIRSPRLGPSNAEIAGALERVTRAWAQNQIDALFTDIVTAVADPANPGRSARPRFSLAELVPLTLLRSSIGSHDFVTLQLLMQATDPRPIVGGARLDRDLRPAVAIGPLDRLSRAQKFLKLLSGDERGPVLGAFVDRAAPRLGAGHGGPERFAVYLWQQYPLSHARQELEEQAIGATTSTAEGLSRGRMRELAQHTAGLDSAVHSLSKLVGVVTGRRVDMYARRELDALEAIARDDEQEVSRPGSNAEHRARAGVGSNLELSHIALESLKLDHEEDRKLRQTIVDFAAQIVEIGGRSLLVAFTGPAGIVGLASGLLAIIAARGLRKAALGEDYTLLTPQNAGTLATEVTGTLFEAHGEKRVEKLFGWLSRYSKTQSVVKEAFKTSTSEAIDSVAERLITQDSVPTFERMVGKFAGAWALGLGKTGLGWLAKDAALTTGIGERWAREAFVVWVKGPPPKAALVRSMLSEYIAAIDDPTMRDSDRAALFQRMLAAARSSVLAAMSTGAAFGKVKQDEARRLVALSAHHPDVPERALLANPDLSRPYLDELLRRHHAGERHISIVEWTRAAANGPRGDLRSEARKALGHSGFKDAVLMAAEAITTPPPPPAAKAPPAATPAAKTPPTTRPHPAPLGPPLRVPSPHDEPRPLAHPSNRGPPAPYGLRDAIDRVLRTASDLDAFVLDHFPDARESRLKLDQLIDRVGLTRAVSEAIKLNPSHPAVAQYNAGELSKRALLAKLLPDSGDVGALALDSFPNRRDLGHILLALDRTALVTRLFEVAPPDAILQALARVDPPLVAQLAPSLPRLPVGHVLPRPSVVGRFQRGEDLPELVTTTRIERALERAARTEAGLHAYIIDHFPDASPTRYKLDRLVQAVGSSRIREAHARSFPGASKRLADAGLADRDFVRNIRLPGSDIDRLIFDHFPDQAHLGGVVGRPTLIRLLAQHYTPEEIESVVQRHARR